MPLFLKYAYPVIFFFLMALVVFWTMNDLQCTKILPAHSEERRQFRLVYAKTLRSAVISCYFCLSQTLVLVLHLKIFSSRSCSLDVKNLSLQVCQDYDIKAFRYIISSIYKKVRALKRINHVQDCFLFGDRPNTYFTRPKQQC